MLSSESPSNQPTPRLPERQGTTETDSGTSVARDAMEACNVALSILNNLLLYDRIEDGSLLIYSKEMDVDSFIHDCVSMFAVQVIVSL